MNDMVQASQKFAQLAVERARVIEAIDMYERKIESLHEQLYFVDKALADMDIASPSSSVAPKKKNFTIVKRYSINQRFFDIMVYTSEKNVLCSRCDERKYVFILCKHCPYHCCIGCAKTVYDNNNNNHESKEDQFFSCLADPICKGCYRKLNTERCRVA